MGYKPFLSELNVLIKRTFKQIWRRPLLLRLQLALALITGLLSIAIFKSGMNRDIAGIQNRIGFFFFQLAFFGFAGITSTDLILEERTIFMREIQGKFFTPLAYYLSKVIVDGVMLRILPMVLYDILVYWSIGLRPGAAHFFVYLISTVLFSMTTGALCLAVTMGSKTGGVASLGIILLLLFSILFGGFLSNRSSMPCLDGSSTFPSTTTPQAFWLVTRCGEQPSTPPWAVTFRSQFQQIRRWTRSSLPWSPMSRLTSEVLPRFTLAGSSWVTLL